MLKLKFLGTGSAFDTTYMGQTNAVLTNEGGRHLLIDCGGDCRHMAKAQGVKVGDIDGVYVSHLHADHIGGLEWLAFSTYFNPEMERPKLYVNHRLMYDLWDKSLRGGLESVEGKVCNLTDFFDTRPVMANESFTWSGAKITPVQTVHIMNGMEIVYSYGLTIDVAPSMDCFQRVDAARDGHHTRVFYTADTQFAPRQLVHFYSDSDLIFHDCETSKFKSNVHAHIQDLRQLPADVKKKMWLMHYQFVEGTDLMKAYGEDGFAGFARPGDTFELGVPDA